MVTIEYIVGGIIGVALVIFISMGTHCKEKRMVLKEVEKIFSSVVYFLSMLMGYSTLTFIWYLISL